MNLLSGMVITQSVKHAISSMAATARSARVHRLDVAPSVVIKPFAAKEGAKARARRAVLANPEMSRKDVALLARCSLATVRVAKQQLRAAGQFAPVGPRATPKADALLAAIAVDGTLTALEYAAKIGSSASSVKEMMANLRIAGKLRTVHRHEVVTKAGADHA